MERGILVDPKLKSSNDGIWAAGDVCQIWSDELKEYRFLHGWRNVRLMGELAARNMTGAQEEFDVTADFIGPSVTFATAKVTKTERRSGGQQQPQQQGGDPWSSGGGGTQDSSEPPF